jgi:GMP synthase (glutamine-hydrolysing)
VRVLSLIHQPDAPTGTFAEAVLERGDQLLEWTARNGPPPQDPESFDAILVFGGAMHADQEEQHPWLRNEDELLRRLLDARVPTFGVCLGGQLLAKAAGGHVGPAPDEEIGWHEVELTPDATGDPVFGEAPPRFEAFQWHSYAFGLPPGATPLALNPVGLQAYRLDDFAWGIQFHAEVTEDIVKRWIATDGNRRRIDFAPMESWTRLGRGLADRFLDLAARRPRPSRRAATRAR